MNGWTAVLPLLGVVIGASIGATTQYWLSRSAEKQRQREWLRDNKRQEWRELISTVSRSVRYILDNSFGVVSGEQEKGLLQANAEARSVIDDRIFVRPLMKLNYFAVCFITFGVIGCDFVKPSPAERTKLVTQNHIPVHRFVITRDSGLALDTQTGQLCRTWEWVPTGKQKFDADGNPIPRNYGEFTPTCLSVYQQYPSGKDSQTELIPDSSSNQ